jgi:hypothetical protein
VDKAWLERVEGADIRRTGPTWAAGQERVVGTLIPMGYALPGHVSDPLEGWGMIVIETIENPAQLIPR